MFKKQVLIGLLSLTFTNTVFAGIAVVSDPTAHGHLLSNKAEIINNLKEAKKHTDQLLSIKNEMISLKNSVGYFKGDATSIKNDLLNWKSYYDKIDTLDSDNFSAFNWLGLDGLTPGNYASNTTDFIKGKFNSEKAVKEVKLKIFDDGKHPEEMKYHRQELAHNSMAASIVVSNESKQSLSDSKKRIFNATSESLSAPDLTHTVKAQNKLLGIIASEMVQQRQLQAQQLEMIASFFSKFEGTAKLTEPSKRTNKKSPWD